MKNEYKEIFKDLYDEFGSSLYFEDKHYNRRIRPIRFIKESIDNAILDLKPHKFLRPDSKLFLLINFYEMLYLPIIHIHVPIYISEDNLKNIISEDIRLILKTASDKLEIIVDNKIYLEEISSHLILKTISELWDKLKLNKLDIWG